MAEVGPANTDQDGTVRPPDAVGRPWPTRSLLRPVSTAVGDTEAAVSDASDDMLSHRPAAPRPFTCQPSARDIRADYLSLIKGPYRRFEMKTFENRKLLFRSTWSRRHWLPGWALAVLRLPPRVMPLSPSLKVTTLEPRSVIRQLPRR